MFCDNEVSRLARAQGGRDVRSRSAALVDGQLKLDFPPDTLLQMNREGLSAHDWIALVFTHSHDDHFARSELQYFLYPFVDQEYFPFPIYGNATICERMRDRFPDWPIELIETSSFQPVAIAEYTITPIKANHKLDEDSHNLIVQNGSRTLLYATDTGMWHEETWAYLQGVRLDGLVVECTEGFHRTEYYGHLDIAECVALVSRLREMGTLAHGAPVVTTHHAASGGATHRQLEETLAPHGITPGYDGIEIEV
jgi:phosphoribosyl 1,2-cyclic phosphate phosphodiesterase